MDDLPDHESLATRSANSPRNRLMWGTGDWSASPCVFAEGELHRLLVGVQGHLSAHACAPLSQVNLARHVLVEQHSTPPEHDDNCLQATYSLRVRTSNKLPHRNQTQHMLIRAQVTLETPIGAKCRDRTLGQWAGVPKGYSPFTLWGSVVGQSGLQLPSTCSSRALSSRGTPIRADARACSTSSLALSGGQPAR